MIPTLVLASSSVYRAELLKKLGIPFIAVKPQFNEDEKKANLLAQNKSPVEIAENLSKGKALSIVDQGNATILAGDQLIGFEDALLGKSHQFENAFKQLKSLQGKTHELITAVTILQNKQSFHMNHITRLKMKKLSDTEITNYLHRDQPFDCAGSYKIEKSGIILFDKIETDDFTAIEGIPMIWVSKILKELKYEFFQS